jgi:hypothetical protein
MGKRAQIKTQRWIRDCNSLMGFSFRKRGFRKSYDGKKTKRKATM